MVARCISLGLVSLQAVLLVVAGSGCLGERTLAGIGAPWKEVRVFRRDMTIEARLLPHIPLSSLFPQDSYSGFVPAMSSAEARNKHGLPREVREENGKKIYVYSREDADVEVVEWWILPSGISPPREKVLTSEVWIKLRHPLTTPAILELVRRVKEKEEVPDIKTLALMPADLNAPIIELDISGETITDAVLR
jgi:hypothetical protein